MAYSFTVRQNGLFRRKLNISDITGEDLVCGMQDRFFRFFPVVPAEGYVIIYDPKRISCGIRILWDEDMREEAVLSIPHIASVSDLALLETCLSRIMKKWHEKKFIFENRIYDRDHIASVIEDLRHCILEHMKTDPGMPGESSVILIHGAKWPLFLLRETVQRYAFENDEAGFAKMLSRMQDNSYDYCTCHVYISDDQKGYIGVYNVRDSKDSIIPDVPRPPLGMTDPVSGDIIRCEKFLIRMVGDQPDGLIGQMEYRSFLSSVPANQKERYDEHHILLKGFTGEQFVKIRRDEHESNQEYSD